MKKYLFLFVSLISLNAYSQMDDGDYTFSNSDSEFKFSIASDGWTISSTEIKGLEEDFLDGYWKEVNGEEEDYDGPEGWYEFQTDQCNYNFDAPIDGKLTLKSFDCVKSEDNKTIELTNKE